MQLLFNSKYITARKTLELGDILVIDTNKVALYIGFGYILEDSSYGSMIVPMSKYFKKKHKVCGLKRLKASPYKKEMIVKKVFELLMRKHSPIFLVWYFFLRLIFQSNNPNMQIGNIQHSLTVSETVVKAYKLLGYDVKLPFTSYRLSPQDFLESKFFEKVIR